MSDSRSESTASKPEYLDDSIDEGSDGSEPDAADDAQPQRRADDDAGSSKEQVTADNAPQDGDTSGSKPQSETEQPTAPEAEAKPEEQPKPPKYGLCAEYLPSIKQKYEYVSSRLYRNFRGDPMA